MKTTHWTSRRARILAPKRREDVGIETIGDDRIVSDAQTGATHHLNATAAMVWSWCDGRTMTRAMARRLTQEFDVKLDDAQDHVDQLVSFFAASNLLETAIVA